MKKAILVVIVVFIITLTGCQNPNIKSVKGTNFNEWISPDGVHYWYYKGTGGYSMLAPRYDNNGDLMIDRKE